MGHFLALQPPHGVAVFFLLKQNISPNIAMLWQM
jgi:hypothetical protein